MSKKNLAGQCFGKWKVLKLSFMKNGHSYWKCLCSCGTVRNVLDTGLTNGTSKSCGCFKKEILSKIRTTHGMKYTKFYQIWAGIKKRCNNSNNPAYKHYGARGITVCERWLKFENFRDDMYQEYLNHIKKFGERNTSIDRKNNNGNYELSNCEFATYEIQANNKRNNRLITYKGQTLSISQWEKKLNIRNGTLHDRLVRHNWTIERAMTQPLKSNHYLSYKGKTLTIAEWARELNLSYKALFHRIERGWSIELAITTPLNFRKIKKS